MIGPMPGPPPPAGRAKPPRDWPLRSLCPIEERFPPDGHGINGLFGAAEEFGAVDRRTLAATAFFRLDEYAEFALWLCSTPSTALAYSQRGPAVHGADLNGRRRCDDSCLFRNGGRVRRESAAGARGGSARRDRAAGPETGVPLVWRARCRAAPAVAGGPGGDGRLVAGRAGGGAGGGVVLAGLAAGAAARVAAGLCGRVGAGDAAAPGWDG